MKPKPDHPWKRDVRKVLIGKGTTTPALESRRRLLAATRTNEKAKEVDSHG